MKITPQIIAACKKAGACKEGLAYISVKDRTFQQLYTHNRDWFFWLINILPKAARDAYYAAVKPARDAYDAVVKPADYAYYAAVETGQRRLGWPVSWLYRDAYYAALKTANDTYDEAKKTALIAALRKTFA